VKNKLDQSYNLTSNDTDFENIIQGSKQKLYVILSNFFLTNTIYRQIFNFRATDNFPETPSHFSAALDSTTNCNASKLGNKYMSSIGFFSTQPFLFFFFVIR